MELLTYIGLSVLRASTFESRVVKSSVALWVNSGVLRGWLGVALYGYQVSSHHTAIAVRS